MDIMMPIIAILVIIAIFSVGSATGWYVSDFVRKNLKSQSRYRKNNIHLINSPPVPSDVMSTCDVLVVM